MRIRPTLHVRGVDLRQPEPRVSAPYREVFRAPVRFSAGSDRLCFTASEWDAPTETADVALVRLMEEHGRILAHRIPQAGIGLRSDVQTASASALPEGGSADSVARSLNVSVRTLQRKLVDAGTTFREISEAVRNQLAEGYLSDPAVSISEVAFLLGFSEESAFNRAFRRWTGSRRVAGDGIGRERPPPLVTAPGTPAREAGEP